MNRSHERNQGQATVEFAMAVTVFILVLFTVIEGGRFMFTWTLLSDASRVGARTAVLTTTSDATTVKTAAVNTAKWVPGLSSSNVTVLKNGTAVTGSYTKTREADTMTVRINYTFSFLFHGRFFPFSSFPITVETDMVAEG